MKEANTLDLSLLILLAFIWGSSFFNIKIATYSYDPITLALVRVIFASIPLLILCKISGIKIEAFSKAVHACHCNCTPMVHIERTLQKSGPTCMGELRKTLEDAAFAAFCTYVC